jgi:hypothetical protein
MNLIGASDQPEADRRGLPSWAAVAWAVTVSVAAAVADRHAHHGMGVLFAGGYALGCVGAVVMVRFRGLLGPTAQPPLILLLAVTIAVLAVPGQTSGNGIAVAIGAQMMLLFPLMAVITGVTLAVGALRRLIRGRGGRTGSPLATPGQGAAEPRP